MTNYAVRGPIAFAYAKPNHVFVLNESGNVLAEIPDPFAGIISPFDVDWEREGYPNGMPVAAMWAYEDQCAFVWENLRDKYPSVRCLAEAVLSA